MTTERNTAGNSGFAKKRVQWLIQHSATHQILWYVDSLVLRNPLLRKAAKRYMQSLNATAHSSTFGFPYAQSRHTKTKRA